MTEANVAPQGDKEGDSGIDNKGAAPANGTNGVTPPDAGTILKEVEGEAGAAPPPPSWPENWRELMAGKNEDFLKQLKRFKTPEAVANSYGSLRAKIGEGLFKAVLPEGATPEQVAEWRSENGIPAEPSGYELPKIPGFEWREEDKPVVDAFLAKMHEANLAPKDVQKVAAWYAETIQSHEEAQFNGDIQAKTALEDELRVELGPKYRGTINLLTRYVQEMPEAMRNSILTARDADGKRLIDSGDFVRDLIGRAEDKYGPGAFALGTEQAGVARKEEIKRIMQTDFSRYKREGLDQEYQRIIEAEQHMAARTAARR